MAEKGRIQRAGNILYVIHLGTKMALYDDADFQKLTSNVVIGDVYYAGPIAEAETRMSIGEIEKNIISEETAMALSRNAFVEAEYEVVEREEGDSESKEEPQTTDSTLAVDVLTDQAEQLKEGGEQRDAALQELAATKGKMTLIVAKLKEEAARLSPADRAKLAQWMPFLDALLVRQKNEKQDKELIDATQPPEPKV